MHYDYSDSIPPPAVERMAAAPRLGLAPGRVERPCHCAGAGCDAGRGEPVAQAGARRKRSSSGASDAPGPSSKLSAEQKAVLVSLLEQGAEAHGFLGNVWTTKRVAA